MSKVAIVLTIPRRGTLVLDYTPTARFMLLRSQIDSMSRTWPVGILER